MADSGKSHRESKQMSVRRCQRVVALTTAVLGFAVLFVFFHFFYRYHLYHREQFSLFLMTPGALREYFTSAAPVSRLAGDFLTQFFLFTYAGPAVMAFSLTLLGVLVYRLFFRYLQMWAFVPAVCLTVVETGRQCGLTYPLSSTYQWIGLALTLLLCRWLFLRLRGRILRYSVILLLGVGVWLFGWGDWEKRSVNSPNFSQERMLAVDSEHYFGRLDVVGRLLDKYEGRHERFNAYYRNLWLAEQFRLSDDMMHYYQPFELGLYLPVDEKVSYPIVYASGELWFLLGDMTNAEHSTMLGMIFSPEGKGVRPLKRLAEINLINGDEEAALKYLRILEKTLFYRRWARMRMPGKETPDVRRWLTMKRSLLPTRDVVRAPLDLRRSLEFLLESNPDNVFASQYLLSFDLMHKDIELFFFDYNRFCRHQKLGRVWAEALLIWMSANGTSETDMMRLTIPPQTVDEFREYNSLFSMGGNNLARLQRKFGNTYWFFFHFASMNGHE